MKKYESPEVELIRLDMIDVITSSTDNDLEEDETPWVPAND